MSKTELVEVKSSVSKHQFMIVLETELFTLCELSKSLIPDTKTDRELWRTEKISSDNLIKVVDSIKRLSTGITEPMVDSEISELSKDLTLKIMLEMLKTPEGTKKVVDDVIGSLKC